MKEKRFEMTGYPKEFSVECPKCKNLVWFSIRSDYQYNKTCPVCGFKLWFIHRPITGEIKN